MLTIHHLYDSRSERLLYAASAFAIPHEVRAYARDPQTGLAPADYKTLHPLGTAPVMQNGSVFIAESGAALTYMAEELAKGNGIPAAHSSAYYRCIELLHFVEGSLFANLMTYAMLKRGGGDAAAQSLAMIDARLQRDMEFLTQTLGTQRYLCGHELTIADAMLPFTFDSIQGARFTGAFALRNWRDYATLNEYADRLRDNEHYRYSMRRDF